MNGSERQPPRPVQPADLATLWIGERLGRVERACLRSALREGHRITLYCYRPPDGLVDGLELADAGEVIPEHRIFRHRSGSVAPFADWFRYELLSRAPVTWIDTDLYFLKPITGREPYLFGRESPALLNNAVLRIPPGSPMLDRLLEPFRTGRTPDWLPLRSYIRARLGELVWGEVDNSRLAWGATGPHALTAVASKLGLRDRAVDQDIFFPVPWQQADWLKRPALHVEEQVTRRTVAIHLWNERIRSFKDGPAPPGSFLERLHREGAD